MNKYVSYCLFPVSQKVQHILHALGSTTEALAHFLEAEDKTILTVWLHPANIGKLIFKRTARQFRVQPRNSDCSREIPIAAKTRCAMLNKDRLLQKTTETFPSHLFHTTV